RYETCFEEEGSAQAEGHELPCARRALGALRASGRAVRARPDQLDAITAVHGRATGARHQEGLTSKSKAKGGKSILHWVSVGYTMGAMSSGNCGDAEREFAARHGEAKRAHFARIIDVCLILDHRAPCRAGYGPNADAPDECDVDCHCG